jgi:hypothetical protein
LYFFFIDGTVVVNWEVCLKGEKKVCACDRQQLFYGLDPMICEQMTDVKIIEKIKHPGYELTDTGE